MICDDAYFGLFYEAESCHESLFARLNQAHEGLLAVKVDGATKENYVWGFRLGFLTLAARGLSAAHFTALEQKLMGGRALVGVQLRHVDPEPACCAGCGPAPTMPTGPPNLEAIAVRYRRVRELLAARSGAAGPLQPLPFNSGYFLTPAGGGRQGGDAAPQTAA